MNRRHDYDPQWNPQGPRDERGGQSRWQPQQASREFGRRDQGWADVGRREPGYGGPGGHNEQQPSAQPDYSNRYSTRPGGDFEGPSGEPGYYADDPLGRGNPGGQYGGHYGSAHGSDGSQPGRQAGTNLLPQVQGGGHYTQSGYGGSSREFGSSYGRASGYADESRFGHEPGRESGYRGSMHGAGQGTGSSDYSRSYARGAGGGAYGSGMAGEYGGPSGQRGESAFRGRGPKGYARSDDRLHEDICERMTDDPHIDAGDISVETRDGIVTLSGTVSARWMKYHAEDLVDRCPGVKDIKNQLSVQRGERSSSEAGTTGEPSLRNEGEQSRTKQNEGGTRKSH